MTQEEKAKAYDEALERASKYHTPDSNNTNLKAVLENIFPELRESEDERIRKSLIELVEQFMADERKEKTIAYLEKQKEQNHDGKKWLTPEELHRIEQLRYEAGFDAGVRSEMEKQKGQKPSLCDKCEKKPTCLDTKYGDDRAVEQCINFVEKKQKSAEWAELQSEFRNINEAFEDGKKEVAGNPEKYELCKPAEWSEEDEEMISNIISSLRGYTYYIRQNGNYNNHEAYIQRQIEFLNSLRPSWKPSEE